MNFCGNLLIRNNVRNLTASLPSAENIVTAQHIATKPVTQPITDP